MSTPRNRSAFTLLEMVIAVAILSTVMAVAAQSMLTGTQMSQTMDSSMAADSTSRRVVANLISEMRSATNNAMTNFALDADSITFDVCTGIDASGNPIFGQPRSFVYDAAKGTLVKIHNFGEAGEYTELLASNLPANAFNIVVGADDDAYTVSLKTQFSDAQGNACTRTTTGSVFLREGLVSPEASIASAGTTSGGTSGGTTPVTPVVTDPVVIVPTVNVPTVTITMTRSASGKDVTGTVVAEVPSSDSIASLTVNVSAGDWSANTDSSSSTYKQVKRVQISGVKSIDVTVSASATSTSGGSKSASKLVAK